MNKYLQYIELFEKIINEEVIGKGDFATEYKNQTDIILEKGEKLNNDFKDYRQNLYENEFKDIKPFIQYEYTNYHDEDLAFLSTEIEEEEYTRFSKTDLCECIEAFQGDNRKINTVNEDKLTNNKVKLFNKLCIISASFCVLFIILGYIFYQLLVIFSFVAVVFIVAIIVLLILKKKEKEQLCVRREKLNERIFDNKKSLILKRIKELDKKISEYQENLENDHNKLERELKTMGDDTEEKIEQKQTEMFNLIDDIPVRLLLLDAKKLKLNEKRQFISDCKMANVENFETMQKIYNSLLKDIEIKNEEKQRKLEMENLENIRREEEYHKRKEAEETKRRNDELEKMRKSQETQARTQEEQLKKAKEAGDRFRYSTCPRCQNYSSCMAKFNLTGPCGAFTPKR